MVSAKYRQPIQQVPHSPGSHACDASSDHELRPAQALNLLLGLLDQALVVMRRAGLQGCLP